MAYGFRIRAFKGSVFSDNIQLYGMSKSEINNEISVITNLEVTVDKKFEMTEVPPFLSLTFTQAQELMDSLWDCGLRPSEGSGSAGALAATQRHLDDMRRLVFDKIEKDK